MQLYLLFSDILGELADDNDHAASHPPSNAASVPFVFSPPAYRTRAKKSTTAIPQPLAGQPSSAAVAPAIDGEPVTKKSKRLICCRSAHVFDGL